jgi:hypothetical protein
MVMVEDHFDFGSMAEAVWWEMLRQSSDPKWPDRIDEAVGLGAPAGLAEQIRRIRKEAEEAKRAAASASITMPAPGAAKTEARGGATSSPPDVSPRGASPAPVEPVGAHGLAGAPPPIRDRRALMQAEWRAQQAAKAEAERQEMLARASAVLERNAAREAEEERERVRERGQAEQSEAPYIFSPRAQPGDAGPIRETYRWRPGPAGWDDVRVPTGLSAVERLTYVWGPVAEIVDWIAWGAPKSSRSMALSVALGVVGILETWRYEGPTESGTHLHQVTLAKTAAGKDHPRKCGINLMRAVAPELLGPTKFASGGGLEADLAAIGGVMLCFVDEMGDQIRLITDQASGQHVQSIIGVLKSCWNGREFIKTGSTKYVDGVTITWPVIGLIGTATPELFFSGMRRSDIEGGFGNRLFIVPVERGVRAPKGRLKSNAQEPPGGLVESLKRIVAVKRIDPVLAAKAVKDAAAAPITLGGTRRVKGLIEEKPAVVEFGPGAMEVYDALVARIDGLEDTNARRYELGARTPEQAIRLATVLAASCGGAAPVIDRRTMEWAVEFAELSLDVAFGGYTKYMRDYLEFPDFCEAVLTRIREEGGWCGAAELKKAFRRHTRKGFELGAALAWLKGEERIVEHNQPTLGRPINGWKLVEE